MRISPSIASKLARLAKGEAISRSQLSAPIRNALVDAGVVRLEKSGASYLLRGVPFKLEKMIENEWGIRDVFAYARSSPDRRTREEMVDVAGNSKALPNRPFDGLFLRSFGECRLDDSQLGRSPKGSAIFVSLTEVHRLTVSTPYIVSVENPACLWNFEKALPHFPELKNLAYTLVLRWRWGAEWRNWLRQWGGQLLHFPDYDPCGIRIFVTEILPVHPEARLLMPHNFESILERKGNDDLFRRHERFLETKTSHPESLRVCSILRKHRKALEQEMLLVM